MTYFHDDDNHNNNNKVLVWNFEVGYKISIN